MKIVIIDQNNETRKAIAAAIETAGEDSVALTTLADLPALLKEVPVSGILIDLITATRATATEKQETNDLIQLYPHAKTKMVNNDLTFFGQASSLKEFILQCRKFTPRTIRKSERRVRHIAFLLSADQDFSQPEKVVTLNISDGGCFVYSTREWQAGDRVWLKFVDNDNVMTGTVRWWQPWGNNKKIPGIGICFDAAG